MDSGKRIDCSLLLNYKKEWLRMCSHQKTCFKCGLGGKTSRPRCTNLNNIGQKEIDIVQKWSDAHPIDESE